MRSIVRSTVLASPLTLAIALAPSALGQFSISSAVQFPIGTSPHGIAALDIDGDGDLDLVAAVDAPDRLAVLLAADDGTYVPGPTVSLGSNAGAGDVIGGDFTGDGIADIAVVLKNPQVVQIWKNSGSGLSLAGSFPTGDTPMGLDARDVDHDGDLDLCLANRLDDTLTVASNGGNGTSWTTVTLTSTAFDRPRGAAFGDVDGDGLVDVVGSSHDNRQIVVFRHVNAGFAAPVNIALDPKRRPEGIKCADLDGDGRDEIVCASNGGSFNSVSVLHSVGGLTFAPPVHVDSGGVDPAYVALGDLNCDGSADVAVLNTTSNTLALLANNGAGSLGTALATPIGTSPDGVLIADLDHDGDNDVATGNEGSGDVSVVRSTCSSTIPVCGNGICEAGEDPSCIDCQSQGGGPGNWILSSTATYTLGATPDGIAAGDIDHDGVIDLAVTVDAPDRIVTLMGNGDGTFHTGQELSVGNYWVGLGEIVSGDFNLDGWVDFAITLKGSSKVRIIENINGVLANGPSYPTGNTPRGMDVADADLDGDLDIVVANRLGNSVSYLRNDGAYVFAAQPLLATGVDPRNAVFADVNGGPLEIAVPNHEDRTISLFSMSRGSYVLVATLDAGERPEGLAAGDLNGDGHDDLVFGTGGDTPATNGIEVLLATGGLTFGSGTFHPAEGLGASHTALGDLDCDGDLDVVLVNENSAQVALLPNNGSGAFGTSTAADVGTLPENVVLADLAGSDGLDIAVVNKLTGDASIILNASCGAVTPILGDLDGDGHVGAADIAILLGQWGASGNADLDGDGAVGAADLSIMLGQWG